VSLEPVVEEFEQRRLLQWHTWFYSDPGRRLRVRAEEFARLFDALAVGEVTEELVRLERLANVEVIWSPSTETQTLLDPVEGSDTTSGVEQAVSPISNRERGAIRENDDEVEPVTSPFGDDSKWFSSDQANVSRFRHNFVGPRVEPWSRRYAPSDSADEVWESVKYMVFKQASQFVTTHGLHGHLDDLVQEACITVLEARATFNGSYKFSTYVHKAVYHAMVDYRDKLESDAQRFGSLDGHNESGAFAEDPADFVPDRLQLRRLLREIPDLRFIVTKLVGYKDDELPDSNVRVRRLRARKAALTATA
jgi:hypothetical protein